MRNQMKWMQTHPTETHIRFDVTTIHNANIIFCCLSSKLNAIILLQFLWENMISYLTR